ncbi:MAG: class I SAM-dependent methyltransferase [Thermodesulfobacteriota bacterium]
MGKFKHKNIGRLLSEERTREIAPERLLRDAGLAEGDRMADIGCGPGFFTEAAARIVGPEGRVFALDTNPEMLRSLTERVRAENVEALLCADAGFPLGDGGVDFTLLAYVLHESDDRGAFLAEAFRISRTGGRILLIDWEKKAEERGPPEEERISMERAVGLLGEAGFAVAAKGGLSPSHYKIIAVKQ